MSEALKLTLEQIGRRCSSYIIRGFDDKQEIGAAAIRMRREDHYQDHGKVASLVPIGGGGLLAL
jgi:hypothetical protein